MRQSRSSEEKAVRTFAFIAGVLGALAQPAMGSVTVSVDVLDPSDGGAQPPAGVIVVDVFVDVSADDNWTAGGFRGRTTGNVRILYASDPNNGMPMLSSPGAQNRFVTFCSQARARDANGRFNNSGANTAGRYCPAGLTATAGPGEINVAWYRVPPGPTADGVDGYVFRLALGVEVACTTFGDPQIFPIGQAPFNFFPLFESRCADFQSEEGTVATTWDVPALTGLDWGLYQAGFGAPCPYDF